MSASQNLPIKIPRSLIVTSCMPNHTDPEEKWTLVTWLQILEENLLGESSSVSCHSGSGPGYAFPSVSC